MKDFLDQFPKLIAIFSFASLLSTGAYEWGYFGVVGRNYQSLLTPYDYIANGIIWFIPMIVILAIVILIHLGVARSEDFVVKEIPTKYKISRFIGNWYIELLWGLLAVLGLFLGDPTKDQSWYLLACLIVMRWIGYILRHPKILPHIGRVTHLACAVTPGMLIVLYGIGVISAYSDMKATETTHELKIKDQDTPRPVRLLRIMEKGMLIYDPPARLVEFIQLQNIAVLQSKVDAPDTRSTACRWFGWPCRQSSTPKVEEPSASTAS